MLLVLLLLLAAAATATTTTTTIPSTHNCNKNIETFSHVMNFRHEHLLNTVHFWFLKYG